MKKILFILMILILVSVVSAREGHMVLLAVKETDDGFKGSPADLYLEIEKGEGRVFIETYPLSKLDTQISTRFAKDVACDYLGKDCERYDFFYTIKAKSSIIGGPSAGGAIAVLTAALLDDLEIDESIAMTGTINSGGIIGSVSGLKAKIDAAKEANVSKVVIPRGGRFVNEEDNFSFDLYDYGEEIGVVVVEASDLTEALYEFTGKEFKNFDGELIIDDDYLDVMKELALDLCNRSKELREELYSMNADEEIIDDEFISEEEEAIDLIERGDKAFDEERYYSSASYCFGANVGYRELIFKIDNPKDFIAVENEIIEIEEEIDKKEVKTITDLEAYMVVKERLKEAKELVKKAREEEEYFARGVERVHSARSWVKFFDSGGKEFEFDKESLKDGCLKKISEAEERYQYAQLFFPDVLEGTREEIDVAYDDLEKEDFELCLFRASKAKAEADIILGAIGIEEDNIKEIVLNKLKVAKRVIMDQQENDIFPILGYSYYEYSNSLIEKDEYSALLYAEYALELSNLDIYFKEKGVRIRSFDFEKIGIFLVGLLVGVMIFGFIRKSEKKASKKK